MNAAATRSERFELRLSEDEADMLRQLSEDDGVSAADYLRRLIRKQWGATPAATQRATRLERAVLVTLAELTQRPGISMAVAFTAPRVDVIWPPGKGSGPNPVTSSVTEFPFRAAIVAQGFDRSLDQAEKDLVEARFPKAGSATWLTAGE